MLTARYRRWVRVVLPGVVVLAAITLWYVKSNPLVFNESLWGHAHCMPQAGLALGLYAHDNQGRFPYHTNGYGDALLLMTPRREWFYYLTGPGYDTSAFEEAFASGGDVDERRCGRVYVQGLTTTNERRIAILFDKVAAPPDHCHFPERLWQGFVREVCFIDRTWCTVSVERWSEFSREQVELLVAAGFSNEQARGLYSEAE